MLYCAGPIATIFTIITKLFLIQALPALSISEWIWRVPVIFTFDLLTWIGIIWAYQRLQKSVKVVRWISTFSMAILCLLSAFMNMGLILYYQDTSAILNWNVVIDFLKDYAQLAELTRDSMGSIRICIFAYLCLIAIAETVYRRFHDFSPVTYLPIIVSHSKQSDPSRRSSKRAIYMPILLFVYSCLVYSNLPMATTWRAIAKPILLSASSSIFKGFVLDSGQQKHFSLSELANYEKCQTLKDTINVLEGKQVQCQVRDEPDYSFLKNTYSQTGIRNVIFAFIESGRRDLFPLDPQSPQLKGILNEKVLNENPLTPFFSELVEHSLFFENVRTASTFTLKSLMGVFCSAHPLFANNLKEWDRTCYTKSLPKLMLENGWSTRFLQSGTSKWDHQDQFFKKIGFEDVIGFQEIDKGALGEEAKKRLEESVNYFGREDMPLIEPIIEWIMKNRAEGRNSLVGHITNVNHDPYKWPSHWPAYEFDIEEGVPDKVRRFFNTVRYTDAHFHKLIKALHDNDLMKETIVIMMGDHGVALGEHGRVGTNENEHEELIKVPLLFYSENEEWRKKYPPQRVKGEHGSIDILPTLLEMLGASEGIEDHFEGKSMLNAAQYDPKGMHFCAINPGAHALVIKQGRHKATVNSADEAFYYDLWSDPREEHPVALSELTKQPDHWLHQAMVVFELYQKKTNQLWKQDK